MSGIRFTKMHGIGNDYVYVDAFAQDVPDPAGLARQVSDRRLGVGSDGLIILLPPSPGVEADLRMRMFNADGSEAEMCGNGIRCVCKYAFDHGVSRAKPMRVETGRGVLELDYALNGDGLVTEVTVDMGPPILEPALIPVHLDGAGGGAIVDHPAGGLLSDRPPGWMDACGLERTATCVSMGNPHLILFCNEVGRVPLESVGPTLERHAAFPERINVHFVEVVCRREVTMRTWERGSGATRACGTGAAAVCVAGVLTGRTDRALVAHLPGGDLTLRFAEDDGRVLMTGPAVEVFDGVWPG